MPVEMWDDWEVMARTLWGEARGESVEGIEAVAKVIINRYNAKKWFTGYIVKNGKKIASIKETCLKKAQFSCWNKNDPNYAKILALREEDKDYLLCRYVAKRAIDGEPLDFTNNATFYHTKAVKPKWAEHHAPCFESGEHLFYNDIR